MLHVLMTITQLNEYNNSYTQESVNKTATIPGRLHEQYFYEINKKT